MKLQLLLELNMNLFVSVLALLLLAASQAKVTSVPDNGEELVPDNGEGQVPDNGEEQVPDNGEEDEPDNGEEDEPDNGEEEEDEPDNGEEEEPDNGEEEEPDSGEDSDETEDISIGILISNNGSAEYLLEGDIEAPKTRNAMNCWRNSCRWPKGRNGKVSVPYTVSREFDYYDKRLISSSLKEIERRTCLQFVPRQRQHNYISVVNGEGCYSALGRQGRGKQMLSLKKKGCLMKGIIQHEFLHAVGFTHEQTRSDRDRYVRINWNNMKNSMAFNFYKSNTNNQNTPYDYNSIMHYGRTAFSTNGQETITPLTSGAHIGQRQTLSYWDIKRIKLLYGCK